jgi:mannonate dehydratase
LARRKKRCGDWSNNVVSVTWDEGKTDMFECLRAYRDIGFEGVLRPDHVPTMQGDTYGRPGHTRIGRLFAIGYIKGLREAVYAE